MDKPRWLITFILGEAAVILSFHDSLFWTIIKIAPLALSAYVIEEIRSSRQNRGWK